jgi:hypothetical protein
VDRDDGSTAGRSRVREARLRPEFAHLYPALEADRWESAARMADQVVAWLVRQPNRGYVAPERVLRSEHFEFRGGTDKAESRTDQQRRRTNPAEDS